MEKELITLRIAELNKLTEKVINICNHCQKSKSTFNCLTCQDQFCSHCYETIHNKVVLSTHEVTSLDQSDSKDTQVSSINGVNAGGIANILEENSKDKKVSWGNWRKLETFNFPINKNSASFYTLKLAYNVLVKLYISENGITKENQIEDLERPLKFNLSSNHPAVGSSLSAAKQTNVLENEKDKELNGNLDLTYENGVNQIMNIDAFNTEEKILINRVTFLTFKRKGAKASFEEVLKKLKILEVNFVLLIII